MARTRSGLVGLALLLGWLAATPTQASAEYFMDVYGGFADTASDTVAVEVATNCFVFIIFPGCTRQAAAQTVDFDKSVTIGGRLGYWSDSHPWLGGAIDVSHFKAEGDNVDISVFPVSFLLMLRMPLMTSEEFPKGRLQPYVGAGGGFLIADAEVDFRPALPFKVDKSGAGGHLDTRAGLAWQFHPHFALFGEYRFTLARLNLEDKDLNKVGAGTVETNLRTNHFLGGVSFRF